MPPKAAKKRESKSASSEPIKRRPRTRSFEPADPLPSEVPQLQKEPQGAPAISSVVKTKSKWINTDPKLYAINAAITLLFGSFSTSESPVNYTGLLMCVIFNILFTLFVQTKDAISYAANVVVNIYIILMSDKLEKVVPFLGSISPKVYAVHGCCSLLFSIVFYYVFAPSKKNKKNVNKDKKAPVPKSKVALKTEEEEAKQFSSFLDKLLSALFVLNIVLGIATGVLPKTLPRDIAVMITRMTRGR